jgi:hypothetical protein
LEFVPDLAGTSEEKNFHRVGFGVEGCGFRVEGCGFLRWTFFALNVSGLWVSRSTLTRFGVRVVG